MKTAALGLALGWGLIASLVPARGDDAPPSLTVPLWPGAVPGESGSIAPESAETKGGILRISNVSTPTMTLFRPGTREPPW